MPTTTVRASGRAGRGSTTPTGLAGGAGDRLPPEDALARAITAEWGLIHSPLKPSPLAIARALLARLRTDKEYR